MMKQISRRDFLKGLAVGTVSLSALALAGCSNGESGTSGQNSGTNSGTNGGSTAPANRFISITQQVRADINNFDPFGPVLESNYKFLIPIYESLFLQYEEGVLSPGLAKNHEVLDDGTYRIYLNENIYDQEGNPITADDVVFCYKKALELGKKGADFSVISDVRKVDDTTVDMTFSVDYVGGFAIVAKMPLVSQKAYEASSNGFANDPVCSGPYYVKEWNTGTSITYEKVENYWRKDDNSVELQNCDEIKFQITSESSQITLALETHEIDFATDVAYEDLGRFGDGSGFKVLTSPNDQLSLLIFNNDKLSPCSDVRVRQAVAYAIDVNAIVQNINRGVGGACTAWAVPGDGKIFYSDYPDFWDDKDIPYPYNPEKAKELLAEAGYSDGLSLRIMSNGANKTTCEIIQSFLADVGVDLKIDQYDNALYQTYRYDPTMWDMYTGGGGAAKGYVPLAWKWYLFNDESTGTNVAFSTDEKLQEVLKKCMLVETHSKETVAEAWDYLEETVPIYTMQYGYKNIVCDENVEPFLLGAGGHFMPHMSTYGAGFHA